MSNVRQDAWSEQDDFILAEVTLKHIREGSTQLAAFEEVAERIGRTSAACGFRWNSAVRKQHETEIAHSKSERHKRGNYRRQTFGGQVSRISSLRFSEETEKFTSDEEGLTDPADAENNDERWAEQTLSIDRVIRFLRQWKSAHYDLIRQLKATEKQLRHRTEQLQRLEKEHVQLSNDAHHAQSDLASMNEDYRTLMQIMARARRLALFEEEEAARTAFRMDANGNLERLDSSATMNI